jgi:hypothetical protein
MGTFHWRISWWLLLVLWTVGAILGVNHVHAGFLTSYGADLSLPAWLYITARSLDNPQRHSLLKRLVGRSPEGAAMMLFVASAGTEVSQYYWPHGLFPGVFDRCDIAAYAAGILVCYVLDKVGMMRGQEHSG